MQEEVPIQDHRRLIWMNLVVPFDVTARMVRIQPIHQCYLRLIDAATRVTREREIAGLETIAIITTTRIDRHRRHHHLQHEEAKESEDETIIMTIAIVDVIEITIGDRPNVDMRMRMIMMTHGVTKVGHPPDGAAAVSVAAGAAVRVEREKTVVQVIKVREERDVEDDSSIDVEIVDRVRTRAAIAVPAAGAAEVVVVVVRTVKQVAWRVPDRGPKVAKVRVNTISQNKK